MQLSRSSDISALSWNHKMQAISIFALRSGFDRCPQKYCSLLLLDRAYTLSCQLFSPTQSWVFDLPLNDPDLPLPANFDFFFDFELFTRLQKFSKI